MPSTCKTLGITRDLQTNKSEFNIGFKKTTSIMVIWMLYNGKISEC